mgnify:CR=1 FL=1|tara:strand:+ start:7980 stop:8816 length:837 start_codon:yes stop_codon:yes gene_type:complete
MSTIHRLYNDPSNSFGVDGDIAIYNSNFYFKNNGEWMRLSNDILKKGRTNRNEVSVWDGALRIRGEKKLTFDESNGLNVNNKLTVTGDSSLASTSFNDNSITNVGDISLDTISSDTGTSIAVRLGTDEGNDFIVDTDTLVVEGDNNRVGIGTTSPASTLDVEGTVSYKHTAFSTAGPTDGIDVSDTTVLEVDTSSNNVTMGGFQGGVQGQILYIVKTDTTNFIQLEHNETTTNPAGHQKIYLTSGSDERVVGYGGWTLYCNGTDWFSLSNPTGAADAG